MRLLADSLTGGVLADAILILPRPQEGVVEISKETSNPITIY